MKSGKEALVLDFVMFYPISKLCQKVTVIGFGWDMGQHKGHDDSFVIGVILGILC